MAFNVAFVLDDVEYRNMRYGVSQSTKKPWMSLVFEDDEGYQVECSAPADMQTELHDMKDTGMLNKGDHCSIAVRAVAKADGNSYIMLRAIPEVLEDEEC